MSDPWANEQIADPLTESRLALILAALTGGGISVSNFPATQPVSEAHLANLDIAISALRDAITKSGGAPKSLADVVAALVATLTVTGTVTIGNFPATQPVSGTVAVSNLPATQTVAGTVTVVQAAGSALHANIDNFPATVTVVQAAGTALHAYIDNQIGMGVTDALKSTATNLATAPYSVTTNLPIDYLLSRLELEFSTTQSRTITLTTADGTVLLNDTNTNLSFEVDFGQIGFRANDNLTLAITQTAGACTVNIRMVVLQGTAVPSGTAVAATQSGTWHVTVDTLPQTDVSDRGGRALGHVTVDSQPQADVSDRSGRSLGHVTVDSVPTTPITAATLPLPAGAAQDGSDGPGVPTIPGSGIRGWLRSIYDRLLADSPNNGPDPNNSSTTPLGAGGVFLGTWQDAGQLSSLYVFYESDVAPSANPSDCRIDFSDDGTSWNGSSLTITAEPVSGYFLGVVLAQVGILSGRYYRVRYVNGPTAQGGFFLSTRRGKNPYTGQFLSLTDSVSPLSNALLTRSVAAGTAPNGVFTNLPIGGQDPNNSSITPLLAAAPFTGKWTSTTGFESMLVFAFSDKPFSLLQIEWSDDGVNLSPSLLSVSSLMPGTVLSGYSIYLTVVTTMLRPYYRIRAVGGSTFMTQMEIDSWLYTAPFTGSYAGLSGQLSTLSTALLTRAVLAGSKPDGTFANVSLNALGALETGEVDPQSLAQGRISMRRYHIDVDPERLMGDTFTRGLDTALWTVGQTGTGSLTQGVGMQVMDTGTQVDSFVTMQTSKTWYYHSNTSHNFAGNVTIPDAPGTINNIRRWGVFSTQDGYFFELNGSILQCCSRIAGVDTKIPVGSWSMLPKFVLDKNSHLYEIEYVGDQAIFYIDGLAAHTMIGNVASPRTSVLDFPVRYENTNSGSAVSCKLYIRGVTFQRFGVVDARSRFLNLSAAGTTTVKPGPGTLRHVIVNTAQLGSTLTLYDSLTGSGLKIATVDCSNSAKVLEYDLDFSTGLTLVVAGSVPPDVTVMYD